MLNTSQFSVPSSTIFPYNLNESLRKYGLLHVNDLAFGNTYAISKLLDLNIPKTQTLQRAAISRVRNRYRNHSFTTAYDVFQTEISCRFRTGLPGLDEMLEGGIEMGTITQLYGEPGTCKTQLCHKLCAQLSAENKAIYIDTEGKFRPERIADIASRNLAGKEILKRILVSTPFDSRQQEERILDSYFTIMKDPKIKLLIIDSITNHYLSEYPGRKFLQERMNKLNIQIHILLSIARLNNVAVIITNRPQSFFSDDQMGVRDLIPYGGNALSCTSTHILYMKRSSRNNEFTAKIVKSPIHPNSSASFAITSSDFKTSLITNLESKASNAAQI
jgi:DNA repair protein RadA